MRRARPLAAVLAMLAVAATGCASSAAQARGSDPAAIPPAPAAADGRWVIGAAGDIACDAAPHGRDEPATCQYDDTADLIAGTRLDEVLLLGDNQYETGAYADYLAYFDPTWGRELAKLRPVPGNHEYAEDPNGRPTGYFRYFGDDVRGPKRLGFYSFDLGACPDDPCWHVVALNSELCFAAGGCGPPADPDRPGNGNRMYRWLKHDLASHPDAEYPCTLAYWHHPRFSFSTGSGASTEVQPLWDLLFAASADVVLNGHSHNYQRWEPQDPAGVLDLEHGIREFVVGTGGASHYAISSGIRPDNLTAAQAGSFGVLELTLKATGYRWNWVTAHGQPAYEDASAGQVPCVRATP
jgi:hypothetical protein